MKRYNSLFIDLDDTLIDTSCVEINSVQKVFNKYNIPFDDTVLSLYGEIKYQVFTLGQYSEKAIFTNKFEQLLCLLKIEGNYRELCDEFYNEIINSHDTVKGAERVLSFLKQMGYRLYLTANGYSAIQRKRLVDSGLDKFFNAVFISEDIDLRKPSKAYFDYVFAHIPESDRKKVLVVGDAQSTDILGAKNAGLDSCWLNRKGLKSGYKSTYEIGELEDLIELLKID